MRADDVFAPWLVRWNLTADGEPFSTVFHSWLMPVRRGDEPAMLKVARNQEEREAARLMAWYAGDGAARVLAHEGAALLLERADGPRSLVEMAGSGEDAAACRILCQVAERLHAPRATPAPPILVPLPIWFRQLGEAAAAHGGVLTQAWTTSGRLLAAPRDERVLHGDIHHANVLDGGPRGWLAIDPKGLWGERGYDFGNIFCNPDMASAAAPGAFAARLDAVAEAAKLERARLLDWALSHAGLSAAWTIRDGGDPALALAVAEIAAAEKG
jgi:streptomycin 6-kinase